MLKKYNSFINGEFVPPSSGEYFETFNPCTGQAWALIPRCNQTDVNSAIDSAYFAFTEGDWSKCTASARGKILRNFANILEKNTDKLAQAEVQDNGKLIAEMKAQMQYLPNFYHYFGGLADKIEGAVIPTDKANHLNYTRYEPLGVVLGITAWNSPLLLATMKIAPALAAGNTFVLKPSEHASASALIFAELIQEAGFPPGVINIITGFGNDIGDVLVKHPKVAKIAFTGGDTVGQRVYEAAASVLKPAILELGGKSPNIVFEDANRDKALNGVISGIFAATGQTCIAGSRLLIQENIHDEFIEELIAIAQTAKMGDPMSMDTQVGPLTTKTQYEKVLSYIQTGKEEGAQCILGGKAAYLAEFSEGWFIEPTIFSGVSNQMRIAREEIFGPVLSIIPFKDEAEAIKIANDNNYGLAAGLWTENISRIQRMITTIQAGTIWVNTYRAFSTLSPFGGYKRSGIGRENGQEAIFEYLQTKSVWISAEESIPKNPFIMRI